MIGNTKTNLRDLDKALQLDPTNTNLLKDKQRELGDEIKETEGKIKTEQEALDAMKNTEGFDANSKAARDLQTQIDLDKSALENLKKEAKESASVIGSAMQAAGEQVKSFGNKVKDVGDKISALGTDLTTKVTGPILAAFGTSAKAAVDWESAFTGVMKTVDETANTTYEDLKKDINEIAKTTASSQNEIAATMEIAGQLGVSADNIAEFTKAMVMLGDTTNLTSEEAASAIAKFANVTKMPLDKVDQLGSAIVDLGNNYATTEADIVSMATRLSGAGAQIGLTQGEILGFATALSSVGIEAEMGGSAFSKAMIKMQVATESGASGFEDFQKQLAELGHDDLASMSFRDMYVWLSNDSKALTNVANWTGKTKSEVKSLLTSRANLESFAEVAGMTAEEFVRAYQESAPTALQAFIKGLGNTEERGESTIQMLQDMGFTEVRLRDTLTRLAQSSDLVTDAVARGNQAWEENSAMSAEAEKRYATMETQIQQLKNSITEMAVEIGESLMPYIQRAMAVIGELVEKWKSLDDTQKETILKIAAIVAAVGPALIIVGKIVSAIGTIISFGGTIITGIGTLITIITNVVGAVQAAGAAFVALTGPIGVAIAIIAAVVAAIVILWNNCEEFRTAVTQIWENIKKAFSEAGEAIKQSLENAKKNLTAIWTALRDDFIKTVTNLKTGITTKFNEIKSNISSAMTSAKTSAISAFESLKSGITTRVSNIRSSIVSGFESAVNYIKSLPSQAWNWGRDIIDSIANGIRPAVGNVVNAVSGVAQTIWDYIHFSEPETGPLSNFHTFMPDMMKEMAQGITQGIPLLEAAMNNMANTLVPYNGVNGQAAAAGNMTATNTVNITVNAGNMNPEELANELTEIIQDNINTQIYKQEAAWT